MCHGEDDGKSVGETDRRARSTIPVEETDRRRVLASLGALGVATPTVLAGCLDGSGDPSYEAGEIDDAEGAERTAEEMAAASALAEREVNRDLTPLDSISIAEHEFVLEDDYRGSTIQGTVENAGDDRVEIVEVRVRVYDGDGDQLGRYLDRTGDLGGGTTWEFTVVLLESPADIADYDITVLGMPS